MSKPLISVQDLTVEIKTDRGLLKAVRGVSFDINAGDSIGIVGESGSGKSITLKAILGLLPSNAHVSHGKVFIDGKDLSTLSQKSRRALLASTTGMIFQDAIAALNPVIKVGAQIAEVPRFRIGKSKAEAKEIALSLMQKVGITDVESRFDLYPHQLSGGLRQRIAIAIALSGSPKILFCDEPTTALDVTIQAQVLRLLKELRLNSGLGIVFVTHDLAVVNELCDEIRVMYAGKFVESGTVSKTFNQPTHPYTFSLLKAAPDPDQPVHRLFSISGESPNPTLPVVSCPFVPRCFTATTQCQESEPELLPVGDSKSACFNATGHSTWASEDSRNTATL
jgi:peptide/nickel transport system ATP-binding protein/oligopeptide transport system ATP-binding protein